jgi:hypothetical protein
VTGAAYLGGLAMLALLLGAAASTATLARRRLVPTAQGVDAVLITVVLTLALLIGTSQLLGSVGRFRRGWLAAGLVAVAAVAIALSRSGTTNRCPSTGSRYQNAWGTAVAAVTAAVVFAQWGAHVAQSYGRGMFDGDTLWYHAPFAARFVQSGWVTRLHYSNGDALTTFFPANTELVHAIAAAAIGRDIASPAVNLGWLALALLAGWCAAPDRRAAPATMAAAAVVLSLPVMAATQAGTARNDAAAVALFLSSVAVLARRDTLTGAGAGAVSGLAGGLALGVKVSMLGPCGLLFAGAVIALRGRPRWAWVGAFVASGSFWFLRNLFRVGNPLPYLALHLGPIHLHQAPLGDSKVSGSAIAGHLGDDHVWSHVFRPGLHSAFGPAWAVVLVLAFAGVVLAMCRRGPLLMLGVVGALAMVVYLFTPNSAAGAGTTTLLFRANYFLNLRYATSGLALALVLLPLAAPARLQTAILAVFVALVVVVQFPTELLRGWEWHAGTADRWWGVAIAVGLAAAVALVWTSARRGTTVAAAGALTVTTFVLAAGWPLQRNYFDGRYVGPRSKVPIAVSPLYPWAQRVHRQRIAVAGDFFQYPFYGRDLSNHVQFLGVRSAHGGFAPPATCAQWRAAIGRGRYDYLVIAPPVFTSGGAIDEQIAWTEADPTARRVPHLPGVVYQLGRPASVGTVSSVGCR